MNPYEPPDVEPVFDDLSWAARTAGHAVEALGPYVGFWPAYLLVVSTPGVIVVVVSWVLI